MENLDGGDIDAGENMRRTDRNSETARLVSSGPNTRPSYLNMLSNACGIIFLCIIIYCSFNKGVSLFSFHPILMTLGWMVFMTSAIHAISPGDVATQWMPIRLRSARHWILQLVSSSILLTGFIVILTNKILNNANHFTSFHGRFGLASLIFMSITMLGGIGALYSLKLKNYLPPLYTKLIHTVVGLITYFLGITTICLGFFSNWWTFGTVLTYICFTLVLISMAATVLRPVCKIYFRVAERFESN
ncbi:cytochrome b561 domain-containing protein 2-like [Trichoplusia ni]|uniref:ascorbate ferrireductase (transmembrane) n=1 Tax=Trichoplusia ni TaxID=7111 RepID=A0A7E5X1K1_TRINI|nr:cytochrome b561 domain-containing protein 2-like [Trichoplusia ni]